MAFEFSSGVEEKENIKFSIQQAGCHFNSNKQFLQRNVCIMPHYHSNESPENTDDGKNICRC